MALNNIKTELYIGYRLPESDEDGYTCLAKGPKYSLYMSPRGRMFSVEETITGEELVHDNSFKLIRRAFKKKDRKTKIVNPKGDPIGLVKIPVCFKDGAHHVYDRCPFKLDKIPDSMDLEKAHRLYKMLSRKKAFGKDVPFNPKFKSFLKHRVRKHLTKKVFNMFVAEMDSMSIVKAFRTWSSPKGLSKDNKSIRQIIIRHAYGIRSSLLKS